MEYPFCHLTFLGIHTGLKAPVDTEKTQVTRGIFHGTALQSVAELDIKPSGAENISFIPQIVCIYFAFSSTSSSLVQGVPVKVNSRSSRDQPPGRIQNSNDLDEVFPDPTITQKGQLFSRTGYFLVILPNGTIQATLNNSSIYSKK